MKMSVWLIAGLLLALPVMASAQWAEVYDGGGYQKVLEMPDLGYFLYGPGSLLKLSTAGQILWAKQVQGYGIQAWLTQDGGPLVCLDEDWGDEGNVLMARLSPSGGVLWQLRQISAGTDMDLFCPSADGGVLMAGNVVNADVVLRKCSADGAVEWQRTFGTDRTERIAGVAPAADGGAILIASSYIGDFESGSEDLWILKISAAGEIEWQKRIGGPADDGGDAVCQTSDGGYFVAGHTASFDPDGRSLLWLLKLSPAGALERQQTFNYLYGNTGWVVIHPVPGGGFLTAVRPALADFPERVLVLAVSPDGTVDRIKGYTMTSHAHLWSPALAPTADGGCLIPIIGDIGDMSYNDDAQVMKLSPAGEIEWQKIYGSANSRDEITSVCQAADGGFVLIGTTASHWGGSAWIMKTAPDGTINPNCFFVKDTSSQVLDEPLAPADVQAAAEDTAAVPAVREVAVETAEVITGSAMGSLTALGKSRCTLTLASGGGGKITPSPGNYVYDAGTVVSLSGQPDRGYRFFEWFGNISSTKSGVSLVMDGDKKVTGSFEWVGVPDDGTSGGGTRCFIATAAYDSPDHPHVRLLRSFRDRYLNTTRFGRALVGFYYRHSPPAADFIRRHPALKGPARIVLFPAVAVSYVLLRLGPMPTGIGLFLGLVFFGIPIGRRIRGGRPMA